MYSELSWIRCNRRERVTNCVLQDSWILRCPDDGVGLPATGRAIRENGCVSSGQDVLNHRLRSLFVHLGLRRGGPEHLVVAEAEALRLLGLEEILGLPLLQHFDSLVGALADHAVLIRGAGPK